MANQFFSGGVKLSNVMLHSIDGQRKADITLQCMSIDIYESIMMPTIYAELLINDGIDLQTKFPIIGEEYIEFTYSTPESDDRDVKLNVYALETQVISSSVTSKQYILKLVSSEVYESNKQFVYKKYKDQTSKSIQNLINEYLNTSKDISAEETKGIDELLITKLKPFQAIDKLRRRSISQKYKSSSFCFFENKDGFNFFTLEKLFSEGKKNIGDKVFFYDNNTNQDIKTVNYRNLLAYEHSRVTNSLESVKSGGLKNEVYKLDILTGDIQKISNSNTQFETIDDGGIDSFTSALNEKFGSKASVSMFVPYDSSMPESLIPDKMNYLQTFTQKIVQNLLRIYIYGDASITVGQTITCKIPDTDGSTTKSKENRLISGNYLIAKLRHMITFGGAPTYYQSAELIKGSVLSQ